MRIRIAQDKAQLVQSLLWSQENHQGVFSTYADIMAFAATLGKKYQQRIPLVAIAKEPYPINIEVFHSRGYEPLFKLLALLESQNPQAIASHDNEDESLAETIFEEYANGGLSKLQQQLQGAIDYSERILLILNQEMQPNSTTETDFDLSRFLP